MKNTHITDETYPTIEEKLSTFQKQIIELNSEADEITNDALSNAKTSDLSEYQDILINAISSIKETTANTNNNESFFSKISKKFLPTKMRQSIEEQFIESATLQENIDKIFDSLENSIKATEKDLNTLSILQNSLSNSVNLGKQLEKDILNEMNKLSDNDNDLLLKSKFEGLLRELKSINLVNSNTSNQIKAQISMTSGMAQQLREVRPILKNLIKSQTLVALQNARMGQAKNVRDMVSDVINDFVVKNNKHTQEVILDAIEYSGETIIKKETIEEIGNQHDLFVKEMQQIASEIKKQKIDYIKIVNNVTKKLNKELSNLPKLIDVSNQYK
jgi:hypothetical protein